MGEKDLYPVDEERFEAIPGGEGFAVNQVEAQEATPTSKAPGTATNSPSRPHAGDYTAGRHFRETV